MNHMLSIVLCLLINNISGASANQPTKIDLLKTLIFDNARATVTLNSNDLKQLLKLSKSTSTSGGSLTIGKGQTVIYDGILTNDGKGYDDRTGVFTCPVAGTYLFVVDSLSRPRTFLQLMLNKTEVAVLYADYLYNKNPLIQTSRTVLLKLKQGDHVKVVSGFENVYIHFDRFSGFTGTFLY